MDSTEPKPRGDETLNVEDRIEVTAFVERKAWILEKIKLLEGMPPIDVFYGVEHILQTNSGKPVPGLPTRQEVAAWMAEHEKIEAETEQFDKGDMIRLKKMAKAKSEQNLSPEDTDLIELTLQTLFALDKLMHLLRVRRDMIEQMDMRLRWEDLRVGAWRERRAILDDIDRFVKTRARWSAAVYDELGDAAAAKSDEAPPALARSPTSKFLSLARGARFSHSEALSKEAAAYASRVLAFHNTWITPSGQLLDKMIERRTVPDQLLDEQDRLEDQTKELDLVSKFPMSLVIQWKKADELYGEFKKDQSAGRILQQDIETALVTQPRPRLDEEFVSRTQALNTRLSQISDPITSRSFPRPTNPRYPDQKKTNDDLARILSTELRSAIKAARQAAVVAKQYHALADAVKKIRKLNADMAAVIANLNRVTEKLTNGTGSDNGDGLPPSIESPESLDPLRHSAFFALLPSAITDLETNVKEADYAIRQTKEALITLAGANLEDNFRSDTESMLRRLEAAKEEAVAARLDVERKADLLRLSRRIEESVRSNGQEIGTMRERVLQLVDRSRWKAERGRDGAPLTPDSPTVGLPADSFSPQDAKTFLSQLSATVTDCIKTPSTTLLPSLGQALAGHLSHGVGTLETRIAAFSDLVDFWEDVHRQSEVMKSVRDETHELEHQIVDLRGRLQGAKEDILQSTTTETSPADRISALSDDVSSIRQHVEQFTSGLTSRVPFVTRSNPPRPSAFDHLPFSASALDHSVKTDVNAFSMSIAGGVDSLERHLDLVRLAVAAKEVDAELQIARDDAGRLEESVSRLQTAFTQTKDSASLEDLETALKQLNESKDQTIGDLPARLRRRLSQLEQAISALESAPGSHDPVAHESIVVARKRALTLISNKVDDLAPKLLQLQEGIQTRLEGASLGTRLKEAVGAITTDITNSRASLDKQKEAVEITPLEADDAHLKLTQIAKTLDQLEAQHEQSIASQLPLLHTAKAAVRSSKSFHDEAVAALVTPVVDQATDIEGNTSHLKPLFAEVRNGMLQRLQLVEAGDRVNKDTAEVVTGLNDFDVAVNRTIATCSLTVPDAGADTKFLEIQTEARNHLDEFDNRLALRVSSLQGTFKRLQDLSLPVDSSNALVANRAQVAKGAEERALRSRAQIVDLQTSTAERLSFARQVGIVDKALASVEGSLGDTRSRADTILSSLNSLESATSPDSLDTSISERLALLHSDARSLSELLERATQPLLRNAEGSAQTLRDQVNGSSDPVYSEICSQRDSRFQQAQTEYVTCLTAATDLSARIGEAEARESARLEAEIASQKQAEQDRLRREQEEKDLAAAAAAAAREAEIERQRKLAEEEMRRVAEETARREEAERQARLAAELESKRIADELAQLKEAEDARRRAEEEAASRRVAEEAERFAALRVAEDARFAAEQAQHEAEAAARAAAEDAARQRAESAARVAELEAAAASSERVDVFGLQVAPSGHKRTVSKEELDLKVVIASLRTRLRSLSLQSIIRPVSKAGLSMKSPAPTPLPTQSEADDLRGKYNDIVSSFAQLPARLQDPSAQAELKSLQFEMETSKGMMTRVISLAAFSSSSTVCDNALSDLLEHLDSYPAAPLETTAPHQSDPSLPPEGQLSDRVGFTGAQIDAMKEVARGLGDDERVLAERTRLQQTWGELWEMSMDKINGIPSRPPSSITPSESGSQRYIDLNLEADATPTGKQPSYSTLRRSRASSSLSNVGATPSPTPASHPPHLGIGLGRAPRSISINKTPIPSRSSSRVSTRSISGPIAGSSKAGIPPASFNGRVQGSTFSSRQRTMSNASAAGDSVTTPRRTSMSRPRIPSGMMTPTGAEANAIPGTRSAFASLGRTPKSSLANSTSGPSRSTPVRSPMEQSTRKRKQYVPNQKHRVDVAVAKVVNELDPEYNVTVEPVSWKDQSGKYWIGDKDPKLCFCRILRSQTVMVRVGGGWVELSKFLRGHYDMFRVMPTGIQGSPPREEEERWISSATLLAAGNAGPSTSGQTERGPTTPEPRRGSRVSLSPMGPSVYFPGGSPILVSRDGPSPLRGGTASPSSPRTRAGSSSPLTPLQFMRKAESSAPDLPTVVIRPTTPSRIPPKAARSVPSHAASNNNPLSRSTGSRPAPSSHRLSQWRP